MKAIILAGTYNFGLQTYGAVTLREVIELTQSAFGICQASRGYSIGGLHEASWFDLGVARARVVLDNMSCLPLIQSVQNAMHLYLQLCGGADTLMQYKVDIVAYEVADEYCHAL